jgi:hypothetical protein
MNLTIEVRRLTGPHGVAAPAPTFKILFFANASIEILLLNNVLQS